MREADHECQHGLRCTLVDRTLHTHWCDASRLMVHLLTPPCTHAGGLLRVPRRPGRQVCWCALARSLHALSFRSSPPRCSWAALLLLRRQPEGGASRRHAGQASYNSKPKAPREAPATRQSARMRRLQPRRGRKQRWSHHVCGIAPNPVVVRLHRRRSCLFPPSPPSYG